MRKEIQKQNDLYYATCGVCLILFLIAPIKTSFLALQQGMGRSL